MPANIFEFDDGSSFFQTLSTNSDKTYQFSDDGVNFTMSMSNTFDGNNSLVYSAGGTGGIYMAVGAVPNEVFTLQAWNSAYTEAFSFTGPLSVKVNQINSGNKWIVKFHYTASATATAAFISKTLSTGPGTLTVSPVGGNISHITFQYSSNGANGGFLSLTGNVQCFTKDTHIATPDGVALVQDLEAGDMVRLADGRDVAITWLGEREINTALMHPNVNPICITAGALGNGLPLRDLKVSGDHAIALEGVLYNASTLVNGTTIYQVAAMPKEGFTYYHIETEAHELLLAEGVAAETFIDYAGRDSFENGDEATGQVAEMALPRISSRRLVPDHIRKAVKPIIAAE